MRKISTISILVFLFSIISAFASIAYINPKVEVIEVQPIIKPLEIVKAL